MMYSCIAMLPFFEQFKVDNKEILIEGLTKNNSSINNINLNLNLNKQFEGYYAPNSENSANIILAKQNNQPNKDKNKCSC